MRRYSKGEIIGYLQIIDFIFDDELLPGEVGKSMYLCKCLKCKTRLRVEGKYIPRTTTTCANCNRSPSDRTKLRSKGKSRTPIYVFWQNFMARYKTRPQLYDPHWNVFISFYNEMGAKFESLERQYPDKRITLYKTTRSGIISKETCRWEIREPIRRNPTPTRKPIRKTPEIPEEETTEAIFEELMEMSPIEIPTEDDTE